MRARILRAILAVLLLTTAILGIPLTYTAWLWVEDLTRNDLRGRLERAAVEVVAQEHENHVIGEPLDVRSIRPLVPEDGRLTIVYPTRTDTDAQVDVGAPSVPDPVVESLALGTSGSLRLEVPGEPMRDRQRQALAAVAVAVAVSLITAVAVAVVTARRVALPIRDLAARAARLAQGDFRGDSRRYGIPELDRVSDVLDAATVEIARRLQREHALVADVSHQLRSRLTAVRLRLDELSVHHDPEVVHEAEEAMAQVDRLTTAIDDLVRATRDEDAHHQRPLPVLRELRGIVTEWYPAFREAKRELRLLGDAELCAPISSTALREAVAVLIDNALHHGGGTCTVSVRTVPSTADRQPTVCVEIADEGEGVSDELAPYIFDRGFSGAGSTGVGLALARALIEAAGGRLALQRRRPALFAIFLGAPPAARGLPASSAQEPR